MYPNPYMMMGAPKVGLLSKGLQALKAVNWSSFIEGTGKTLGSRGFNLSSILTNTQKTLGVINQAIPVVYQLKPIMENAKTVFRIADIMRSDDTNVNTNTVSTPVVEETSVATNTSSPSTSPIFYI